MGKKPLTTRIRGVGRLAVPCLVSLALTGCGNGLGDAAIGRAEAARLYQEGISELEGRNYKPALEHFALAIDSGWLNPDFQIDAQVKHAQCRIGLGEFDLAESEITKLGELSVDRSTILLLKSFSLNKRGKSADAQRLFQQAKAINPRAKSFD